VVSGASRGIRRTPVAARSAAAKVVAEPRSQALEMLAYEALTARHVHANEDRPR